MHIDDTLLGPMAPFPSKRKTGGCKDTTQSKSRGRPLLESSGPKSGVNIADTVMRAAGNSGKIEESADRPSLCNVHWQGSTRQHTRRHCSYTLCAPR
jgi:hypothetical protein